MFAVNTRIEFVTHMSVIVAIFINALIPTRTLAPLAQNGLNDQFQLS